MGRGVHKARPKFVASLFAERAFGFQNSDFRNQISEFRISDRYVYWVPQETAPDELRIVNKRRRRSLLRSGQRSRPAAADYLSFIYKLPRQARRTKKKKKNINENEKEN